MSRIGKLPISVSDDITVGIDKKIVKILGPKGELVKLFSGNIEIIYENKQILIKPLDEEKHTLAMWGTVRSIIANMVKGVKHGFKEELEVNGVGYRASIKNNYLNLSLGKSHNTKIQVPNIINVEVPKQNVILLNSIDKEQLGQFIATVIKQRPPEPYKGKGIKKKGQFILRKEGKKTKK